MLEPRQAAVVLALYEARKAVKVAHARRGEKVTHYTGAEISRLAREYFEANRAELLDSALEASKRRGLRLPFSNGWRRSTSAPSSLSLDGKMRVSTL